MCSGSCVVVTCLHARVSRMLHFRQPLNLYSTKNGEATTANIVCLVRTIEWLLEWLCEIGSHKHWCSSQSESTLYRGFLFLLAVPLVLGQAASNSNSTTIPGQLFDCNTTLLEQELRNCEHNMINTMLQDHNTNCRSVAQVLVFVSLLSRPWFIIIVPIAMWKAVVCRRSGICCRFFLGYFMIWYNFQSR